VRLGAPLLVAAAAAGLVGASPEFLYSAAVGTTDVAGMASGAFGVLALVVACGDLSLLPLAGAACGLMLGVRPQTAAVLIPGLLLAVGAGIRSRRWRSMTLGALSCVATAAACWIPAIVATGPRRWWSATVGHVHYMATVERTLHLPGADVVDVLNNWFIASFAGWGFAAPFWILVLAGSVVLVRTGRARLVVFAALSAGCYVVSAVFTMNETASLRYFLPAVPLLAVLAAGGLAAPGRFVRRTLATLVALWCLAAVAWTSPALRERRRPSPVWAALTWIREHCNPATTRVLYDGVITPHIEYVLRNAGFSIFQAEKASILDNVDLPGEQTLFVTPLPVPGADVLFQDSHHTDRVLKLAWGRYGSCAVSRMRQSDDAVYSPEWQLAREGWQLSGTGHIVLPRDSKPAIVRLCAGAETITLQRPTGLPETVAPLQCVVARLVPGPGGALAVSAPTNGMATVPPIQFLPLAALDPEAGVASAYLVPQAAHLQGYGGVLWRTDLVVINPNKHPLRIVVQFLATLQDNRVAPSVSGTLQPGELFNFVDVLTLPEFKRAGTMGALLVHALADDAGCRASGCRFIALSRTYSSPAGVWRAEEWLPGVAPGAALRQGEKAVLSHVTHNDSTRASIGFASWSDRPVRVVARVLDASGATVETDIAELPPFGHKHIPVGATVADGRVEVVVEESSKGGMIVPYASMVDRRTGLPSHMLPERKSPHVPLDGWRPPFPKPLSAR
jgi:hypothetical protein